MKQSTSERRRITRTARFRSSAESTPPIAPRAHFPGSHVDQACGLGDNRRVQPAEVLTCDGVTLRRWRATDAELVDRLVRESLDHLAPWMPWATAGYDRAAAAEFLTRSAARWQRGQEFDYAIVTQDGDVAGSCGLMARAGPGGLEIGYWLHRAHVGKGLATRAVAALTAEAFRVGADRVEIVHEPANTASGAIPRRLGYTEVGRRRGGDDRTYVVWRLERA